MEPYLVGLNVWAWAYLEGTRPYRRSFHVTADEAGCEAIIRCLNGFAGSVAAQHRTIPLRTLDPRDEAKITGGQRYQSLQTLRLEYLQPSPNLQQMLVRRDGARLLLTITSLRLADLRRGFEDIRQGKGDYSILPDRSKKKGWTLGALDRESAPLSFWPCFGHYYVVGKPGPIGG